MPGMKIVGIKTATSTMLVAKMGPLTSFIARMVASLGANPFSMYRSTASTTTMASSTTSPMARTRPKSERVLIEKPSTGKKMKVPISETGTAMSGMRVARQPCRKMKTTMTTRISASKRVFWISLIPSVTASVVSRATVYFIPSGKFADISSMRSLAASAAARALLPGVW